MDAATLEQVMIDPAVRRDLYPPRSHYEAWCQGFNDAMLAAEVTNVARAAMWCAQLGHESVGLKYTREIASGAEYEGRTDLGNTQKGDGIRFAGRGPIQITGRHNYGVLSAWAHGKGYVTTPTWFVDHPADLELPRYGLLGAVWYWTVARPDINALSDARDLNTVTRRINGGLNGIDDRRARYDRALKLGARLLPGSVEWVDVEASLPVLREGDGIQSEPPPAEVPATPPAVPEPPVVADEPADPAPPPLPDWSWWRVLLDWIKSVFGRR